MDERIRRIPAKPLAEVFRELLARRADGTEGIPRLTLDLGFERVHSAELIAITTEEPLTIVIADARGDGPLDVRYVEVAAIRSVVAHASAETLHTLGFGQLRARTGAGPTALELRRRAAAVASDVGIAVELDESTMGESDDARAELGDLLVRLRAVLLTVASDEEGKRALAAVGAVRVAAGECLRATVSDRTLELILPAGREGVLAPTANELQRAIERSL